MTIYISLILSLSILKVIFMILGMIVIMKFSRNLVLKTELLNSCSAIVLPMKMNANVRAIIFCDCLTFYSYYPSPRLMKNSRFRANKLLLKLSILNKFEL